MGMGISAAPPPERSRQWRVDPGVCLLDRARAQNIAIVFRRLHITPAELCVCLRTMDLAAGSLSAEDTGRLLGKLPTRDEARLLQKYAKTPDDPRDIERMMLPFCELPDAEIRLNLAHVVLTHSALHQSLMLRFERVQAAATEVRTSKHLHNLLRTVLKIANYINYGSDEGARAFSLKSLETFASFKFAGTSLLHYLCLTLCDESFVESLQAELTNVRSAAQDTAAAQRQEYAAFRRLVVQTEHDLEAVATKGSVTDSGDSAAGSSNGISSWEAKVYNELRGALRSEEASLQRAFDDATAECTDAQRFFGDVSEELPPSDEFFNSISEFIRRLSLTSTEVRQNLCRWQHAAGSTKVNQQAIGAAGG